MSLLQNGLINIFDEKQTFQSSVRVMRIVGVIVTDIFNSTISEVFGYLRYKPFIFHEI